MSGDSDDYGVETCRVCDGEGKPEMYCNDSPDPTRVQRCDGLHHPGMNDRDIRLQVPHDHSQPGAMFGCPGCIRAVKVAEYRLRCEQMTTEDLIDCTSLDGPPWWWGNIVADEVLRNRIGDPT